MEGNYGVYLGKDLCGKVQVLRQGLYYRFICRCRLSGDTLCRLSAQCDGKQENLGILIPMDGGFGLDTRIPVKHLGEGKMTFQLLPRHEAANGTFVPIYPEEPFAYLSRLKESYLVRRNGQVGALLK